MSHLFLAVGPKGFGPHRFVDGQLIPDEGIADRLLTPGFVDLHIHGAFGYDFMEANRAGLIEMLDHLATIGYEALLPTTITAPAADVQRALDSLPEHPMVAGFHLEGPFISPKFPGAQPPEFIALAPSSPSDWDPILDDPRLKLVTLAPEQPGALELTRRLTARGVRVSMGHTAATFAEAAAGEEAGICHATHAYNAMRGLHHREAGALGYVLDSSGIDAELIYDRKHVSPPAASILLRAKGLGHVIAVSDSTLAAGAAPGTEVTMWGIHARVGEGDVRLADGTLAGSAITLLDAFRNLWSDFGAETAIRACSLNPRRALGRHEVTTWVEFDMEKRLTAIHHV